MPIRSAVEHSRIGAQPRTTHRYFDANLLVGLAVLDAPMISATVNDQGESVLERVKWQRLWRHEPLPGAYLERKYGESSAIDIVHIDFLSEYMQDHLMPFAEEFAKRVLRHDEELATGIAFASGMEADSYTDLETRLRTRTAPWRWANPLRGRPKSPGRTVSGV